MRYVRLVRARRAAISPFFSISDCRMLIHGPLLALISCLSRERNRSFFLPRSGSDMSLTIHLLPVSLLVDHLTIIGLGLCPRVRHDVSFGAAGMNPSREAREIELHETIYSA